MTKVIAVNAPYRAIYDLSRCAQWLDPRHMCVRAQEGSPLGINFDALQQAMPPGALTDGNKQSLQQELATYLHVLQNHPVVPDDEAGCWGICKWWCFRRDNLHQHHMPTFVRVFSILLLLHPNSCAVERLFSVLNDALKDCQSLSLEDKVELTAMTRYNNGKLE